MDAALNNKARTLTIGINAIIWNAQGEVMTALSKEIISFSPKVAGAKAMGLELD